MKILNKIRETGLIFAIIAFTPIFKIWIPVSASQGSVSFGLSELYILLFSAYLIYLLATKKYVLEGLSKNIFFFVIISGVISALIAGIHIIKGQSVFEFIGVIRNLYACSIIYFLYDANKISRKELLNGIMIFIMLMSVSVFYTSVVISLRLDVPKLIYPDNSYIAVAGIALLPFVSNKLNWTLFSKITMVLSTTLAVCSSLLKGSRAAWTLSVFLVLAIFIIMFIKKHKMAWRLILVSVMSSAVIIFSFLAFSNSANVRAGMFRASPLIRNMVSTLYDLKEYEEPDNNDFNNIDYSAEVKSPEDLQNIVSATNGSGMRSNSVRSSAWKAFIKEIEKSPLIGSGARFVEITDHFGNTMLVNSHNFILEIASLLGIIGIIAYLSLIVFVLTKLIFKGKLTWDEKIILLLTIGTIFMFALVQPAISGGITSNIIIWSVLAYMLSLAKERGQTKTEEVVWNN